MTEMDANVNDFTKIQLNCSSMMLGNNGFEIILEEDSGAI
jgi:hypothetical protein